MAAAAVGGMDKLSQFPTLLLYSEPTTPLQHFDGSDRETALLRRTCHPRHPFAGADDGRHSPQHIAGAVALGNAEMLSGLVMHQLRNPGAPFLYGHGVHHLDMKDDDQRLRCARIPTGAGDGGEMAQFYSLPVWGYTGHSDSNAADGQAAADAQFSVLVALLAKTNLNHDVGYLEAGLTNSPEMMVLTNEIISMTRRFVDGVRLDDEALALDVIDEVGPGGEFLSHDHTMAHWREFWMPSVSTDSAWSRGRRRDRSRCASECAKRPSPSWIRTKWSR